MLELEDEEGYLNVHYSSDVVLIWLGTTTIVHVIWKQ